MKKRDWGLIRRRVSEIIEVGASDDIPSRAYDLFGTVMLLMEGDHLVMYTQERIANANLIDI